MTTAIMNFSMRHKRITSILLIMCVVACNIYGLQQDAHAFVLVDDMIFLGAVAITLLVAAGCIFATQQSAHDAAEQFVAECEASADQTYEDMQAAIAGGKIIYNAAADSYQYVVGVGHDWWAAARARIQANYVPGVNYVTSTGTVTANTTTNHGEIDISAPISATYYTNANHTTSAHCNTTGTIAGGNLYLDIYNASNTRTTHLNLSSYNVNSIKYDYEYDYTQLKFYCGTSLIYCVGMYGSSLTGTGEVNTPTGVTGDECLLNPNYDWANDVTGQREFGIPLDKTQTGTGDVVVNGNEDLAVSDVYPGLVDKTKEDVMAQDLTGVQVRDETLTYNPAESVTDYVTAEQAITSAETTTSLKGLFFSKFPFCIPWDLMAAFKLIAAPAEAPHFEVDFLAPLNINWQGETSVAFDMADYPMIGQVCRWCFTVEFCIMLALATRKLIKW